MFGCVDILRVLVSILVNDFDCGVLFSQPQQQVVKDENLFSGNPSTISGDAVPTPSRQVTITMPVDFYLMLTITGQFCYI